MNSSVAAYTETAQVTQLSQEEIVTQHATLVKRIAYHLMSRLPSCVQVEDLIQSGMIGLLEASNNYDPSQGASFETYAGIRIRGSMLDEIRKGDWAPRSLHRKVREISQAIREIEAEKGRDAKDTEVAERLELSLNEYHQVLQDANTDDMLFGVAETVALVTACMTLEPGDLLVMGTPAGVGHARKPPLWMKDGDVCEIEIEQVGLLRNPIVDEA